MIAVELVPYIDAESLSNVTGQVVIRPSPRADDVDTVYRRLELLPLLLREIGIFQSNVDRIENERKRLVGIRYRG